MGLVCFLPIPSPYVFCLDHLVHWQIKQLLIGINFYCLFVYCFLVVFVNSFSVLSLSCSLPCDLMSWVMNVLLYLFCICYRLFLVATMRLM